MSPRTFVARSAAILSLAALGLAACESKTVVQPPQNPLTILVSPAAVTLTAAGQKAQFVAVVSGGTTDQVKTFTWASSAPAVATVDANGVVTAVANGVATITATATADATVKSAGLVTVNISKPDSTIVVPPTISIQQVTDNAGNNVPLTNVAGQINVALNVDVPPGNNVSKVEVLVDGTSACSQSFTQGSSAQVGVEATNAVTIVCSINTLALKADGTPVYANGSHSISARLVGASGNVLASTTQTFVFNNNSSLKVELTPVKTANDATGLVWSGGNLTVKVTPIVFSSATLQNVTISVTGFDPVAAIDRTVSKTITTTGVTAVTATFRSDSLASAGTGIGGLEDATTNVSVSAVTTAGQPFLGGATGTQDVFEAATRYDAAAPRSNTQPTFLINTVGGTSWLSKANTFSQTCSATAVVGTFNCKLTDQVVDLGVDVVKAAFQIGLASQGASSRTYTTVNAFTELTQSAAGTYFARVQYCDNLGNCKASDVSAVSFGIDLTAPVVTGVTDISGVVSAPQTIAVAAVDSLSGFDLVNGYVQVQIAKDSAKSDGTDVQKCYNPTVPEWKDPPCKFYTITGTGITLPATTYPDGYYTVTVQAADIAGNVSTTTSRFFLMDAVAPTVSGVGVTYTTGTFSAGVNGTINDNVDLKQYAAYETFAAAIAGVTAIPFAAPTTVKAFGIPVNGKVTATATTPVILGVATDFGIVGTGSTGFGFGGLDQAGNFALGTVGLVPGTPGAVSGVDVNSALTTSGATKTGVCNGDLADCDAAHQAASTQDSIIIVMANTTTANPIVTMYFYRVVTYGATSVAQFVSSMPTPLPGIPATGTYQNLRVFTYKSAAIAAGDMATGANTLFAIGVDKNGNGVLFGPLTVDVQTP